MTPWIETIRALLAPRRLIPISVVSAPMIVAQGTLSEARGAWVLALIMCVLFVMISPHVWRALFPLDRKLSFAPLRLVLYGALGVIPAAVGFGLSEVLDIGQTFLTKGANNFVGAALFLVGGWGLARDIAVEGRADRMAKEAERAQLLAMRAHLDPHFLFNTLNAIAEWCREDGETAERAILQLSAMLREILAGVKAATWPLDQELDIARKLLDLHLVRDPTRFSIEWRVPEPVPAWDVPPLLLLPLVENAVKHGPAAGNFGPIEIEVTVEAERLTVRVENPGEFGGRRDGGEGLTTVEKRLALAYERRADFSIRSVGNRTQAVLAVPRIPTDNA